MAEQDMRAVRGWLLTLWLCVLLMVMVGGITRLTGSGLSIVEWRPVTGALPPLNEADWREAFDAYRSSPQFVQQNHWMTLADFKQIFFWEYFHRLLGRLIGVVTLLPWAYFLVRRKLTGRSAWRTFSLLLLGGLQGVLGWWMVKSGLANEPRVSHYRLAAHLLLAFAVGQWALWQAIDLLAPAANERAASSRWSRLHWAALCLIPLLIVQLIYGAFMAGTHAGYMAATFPDVNGHYAPRYFFVADSLRSNLFDNPLAIHYLHRVFAGALLVYAFALAYVLRRARRELRAAAYLLAGVTLGQALLGVLTVVLHVPLPVAVAHQGGAYVLCGAVVLFVHAVFSRSAVPELAAAERGGTLRPVASVTQKT